MKRVLLFVVSIVAGGAIIAGLCIVLVLALWPCCAIEPTVTLESVTPNADGTIQILISTTMDDVDTLQVFDQRGLVIATQSTAFEKQVNTYFWQTTIPGNAQQITLSTASPLPAGVVAKTNVTDWLARDEPDTIGFERAVIVRLEPVDWANPRDDLVRLTTTEDVFGQLHLYDATETRIDSIDTAFLWDATGQRFVWELTLANTVEYVQLQLRTPIATMIDVQSEVRGWLRQPQELGFVRGKLPILLLVSTTELDDGRIEMYFEATEPVFELMHITDLAGVIETTQPTAFEAGDETLRYKWQVIIPNDAQRLVFVPVQSEWRRVIVSSNVSSWNEITVENDVGFIRLP